MTRCARMAGTVALAVAAGLPAGLWAQEAPPLAGSVYTCVDAKGRKLTADRPIVDCLDREQKILNPSGTVRAKIGPSLTAQELAEHEAKERRDAQERSRSADEKRRDRALLMRYPARAAHDRERAEALAQVASVAGTAATRLDELAKQRRALDVEMEFYDKDPAKAPAHMRRQLEENIQNQAIQRRFITDQDAEVRRVNERYDEELKRLQRLWAAGAAPR